MTNFATEIELHENAATSAAPDFNNIARVYRWMEWLTFGPALQRCRTAFIPHLRNRRQALILGDGDGRFTAHLLHTNSGIAVDAVDASSGMLFQLARRTASSRVRPQLADARTFQPPRRDYDLIATHFFLDCLANDEVRDLASELRNYVRPNAVWIISEFAIPSNSYGRAIARPLISFLYLAFDILTGLKIRQLPNHRLALAQSGWRLAHEQKRLAGLLISEMWSLDPDF